MEAVLSVAEFAELRGCSPQYVRKAALEGRIPSEESTNSRNRKIYQFPVSLLPADLQQKYYAKRATEDMEIVPAAEPTPFDRFSADEREEIAYWMRLIEEWKEYRRANPGSAAEVDDRFVLLCRLRGEKISKQMLYRRWKALRESDYESLVDMRGKVRRGKCKIDKEIFMLFLGFYLDDRQFLITDCYKYTEMWLQQYRPEALPLPHLSTFRRHIENDVPEAVETLGRLGEKANHDRCSVYTTREYEAMRSNDWWVADNHTLDIISQGDDGKPHRLYLTAFFDARGMIFTGCHISEAPSSQSTLIALRKGILKYGIPENVYVDNGREFLTFDIGGLGHRQKASTKEEFVPPPIFKRLGINMTNAIVRNAQAKVIERQFVNVKNQISRLFETFCGGNVLEKPESLKCTLKNGKIPLDGDLTRNIELLLEWYFNQQAYGGAVARDRGKPRMQVYNENLPKKIRQATGDDLTLMLMRSTRAQTVQRNGVHLDIAGTRIWYWEPELTPSLLMGKKVYLRYDPDDLSNVRVYDLEDRYLINLPCSSVTGEYGMDKEKIKAVMQQKRHADKLTKEALQNSVLASVSRTTALELVLAQAMTNRDTATIPPADPKIIEMRYAEDGDPLLQQAVGGEIDMALMARNASRNIKANGGEDYDEDL